MPSGGGEGDCVSILSCMGGAVCICLSGCVGEILGACVLGEHATEYCADRKSLGSLFRVIGPRKLSWVCVGVCVYVLRGEEGVNESRPPYRRISPKIPSFIFFGSDTMNILLLGRLLKLSQYSSHLKTA